MKLKRGDVVWVNLDPTMGYEIKKTRPCVIVSNDIANQFSPLITVIPVTTQGVGKAYPHEILLNSVESLRKSKAKANQIRTIDKRRVGKKIAALPRTIMAKIDWALANHLDLID